MTVDALFGPAFPEAGWVPAPRYLLRRARVHALARGLAPGGLLEVGPGAGTLLMEFADRGFDCEALEPSAEARGMANRLLAIAGHSIPVHAAPEDAWRSRFDVVCSFDVLEHIEHDADALAQWFDWLRPGGHLLLSVPAHPRLWNACDEWAGHFRRYERDGLQALLRGQGFEVEAFECYGFPLANVSERVSAPIYRKGIRRGPGAARARQANNDRSGIDRSPHLRLYPYVNAWPGRIAVRLFLGMQRLFLRRDLGNGYILRARRPDTEQKVQGTP